MAIEYGEPVLTYFAYDPVSKKAIAKLTYAVVEDGVPRGHVRSSIVARDQDCDDLLARVLPSDTAGLSSPDVREHLENECKAVAHERWMAQKQKKQGGKA